MTAADAWRREADARTAYTAAHVSRMYAERAEQRAREAWQRALDKCAEAERSERELDAEVTP